MLGSVLIVVAVTLTAVADDTSPINFLICWTEYMTVEWCAQEWIRQANGVKLQYLEWNGGGKL